MNRTSYFNYIEEKLTTLSVRIARRGRLNMLELNIHSETFFADLINLIFDFNLVNLNTIEQNAKGIDLVDKENRIVAQVSSTATKQKINNSLEKDIFSTYSGYRFKFVSIAKEASGLRETTYKNPHNALFSPNVDIIDHVMILKNVAALKIEKQKSVYDLVKGELGQETDIVKVDTNLATIINILAAENLSQIIESPEINDFEIEKKIKYNDLSGASETINDYKIFYSRLNEKYTAFDKEGINKSFSVLQIIRKQYIKRQHEEVVAGELFYAIVSDIINIILYSKNYSEIPYEELELCVHILVVDAFIRCKIFENPEGYNHVVTR